MEMAAMDFETKNEAGSKATINDEVLTREENCKLKLTPWKMSALWAH